jgi:hypothetical protein
MDIHKPKPIRNWREFLKEVGIIVLGVSIALSAEQAVEWWHWQHELHETRQTLRSELPGMIGSFQYNLMIQDCSERRLKDLAQWLDRSKPGDRPPKMQPVGQPPWYVYLSGSWEVAKSGQAAVRMPLAERLHYSRLYGLLSQNLERIGENNRIWEQLTQFTGAEPLDHADRVRLHGLIANGHNAARIIRAYSRPAMIEAKTLGITPKTMPDLPPAASFCKPLFAG